MKAVQDFPQPGYKPKAKIPDPELLRAVLLAFALAVLTAVAVFAASCTIAPKPIAGFSTGAWLHPLVWQGQSGQEAPQLTRDKWLTLLPTYGKYLVPKFLPTDKDKGWTQLPNGNWFVADASVTAYADMNHFYYNPAEIPQAP